MVHDAKPLKFITHVALYCADLQRSVRWYTEVLGLRVMAQAPGRFAALSFGHKHHDFALVQAPPHFAPAQPPRVGLYHVSVDTGSFAESLALYERARQAGSEFVKAIDHRVGNGIYVRDPDGNVIELWNEAHASMQAAIDSLATMDPPFEQNPIGFPLDVEASARHGRPIHDAAPPAQH